MQIQIYTQHIEYSLSIDFHEYHSPAFLTGRLENALKNEKIVYNNTFPEKD